MIFITFKHLQMLIWLWTLDLSFMLSWVCLVSHVNEDTMVVFS